VLVRIQSWALRKNKTLASIEFGEGFYFLGTLGGTLIGFLIDNDTLQ